MADAASIFRGIAKDAREGLVLKPLLHSYLFDAEWAGDFSIEFKKGSDRRVPDGWFHPSEHPLWPERMLWWYMTQPDKMIGENFAYMSTLSVTMGKAMHGFIESCLQHLGLLLTPSELTDLGFQVNPKDGEPSVSRPDTNSRGHMDGILRVHLPRWPTAPYHHFEFKCMVPETEVLTADGPLPASEVRTGDLVFAWGDDGICLDRVVGTHDNGVQPTYLVKTRQGRSITVTANHPFLTDRGWVEAADLRPAEDYIRTPYADQFSIGDTINPEAWFVGLMVGDGCTSGSECSLSNRDAGVLASVEMILDGTGTSMSQRGNDWGFTSGPGRGRNYVRDLMRLHGLEGKNSRQKRIPSAIWASTQSAWMEFLAGYFDADGTVVTKGYYPHLSISSVNRPLLEDCQTMFAMLGVQASIMEVHQTYQGEAHQSWRLLIRDARSVALAKQMLYLRSAKGEALDGIEPKPRCEGHHLTARLGWDRVEVVIEGLSLPTIGLEIERTHTHITAGLVTHNTSNNMKLGKIKDLDIEAFMATWPDYYAQAQEYLRMTGLQVSVVLFLGMGFPWEIREFHIPANPQFQADTANKYRSVMAHAEAGTMPPPCCSPRSAESKDCPARAVCPVALA